MAIQGKGSRMEKLGRRQLLAGAGAAAFLGALPGCVATLGTKREATSSVLQLTPVRATPDRITRITVCTRPFRAQGPRLDAERIGTKLIVHNYGHGGSGWSLSWGSSSIAVQKALAGGERDIAVIGCGALGLTSALLLQRAGARVTIYAKDLPPNVRSSLATGVWTPDSRICLEEHATPGVQTAVGADGARPRFRPIKTILGLPGTPVEFIDSYYVSDDASARPESGLAGRPAFANLQRELIGDLIPQGVEFAPGSHSLGQRYLKRNSQLMFNLTAYSRLLITEFGANGGKIEIAEFRSPDDFAKLREKHVDQRHRLWSARVVWRSDDHAGARTIGPGDTAA